MPPSPPGIKELQLRGAGPPSPPFAEVRVRIKPEGLALVAPPGLSLAADSSSPPLKVPGCFVDGFEVRQPTPAGRGRGEERGERAG